MQYVAVFSDKRAASQAITLLAAYPVYVMLLNFVFYRWWLIENEHALVGLLLASLWQKGENEGEKGMKEDAFRS